MSRTEEPGGPQGLAPLPTLPIFFKLQGRRALIVGGGEPAVWKAEVLCAAGAEVEVVAAEICSGLRDLSSRLGSAALRLSERPWREDDLLDAALALGAIEEDGEAARFRDAAHRAGVPVNVIDKPAFCDFQFGTLVSRGPLVVAITTDGAAPVVGQAIRARIEALMPDGLTAWAEAAKAWRPEVQAKQWDFRRRRRFWEAFADLALTSAERAPTADDLAACFSAVDLTTPAAARGHVMLIGSGPGTPDALTFAAVKGLQSADLLLYERGLPAALVNLARREAPRDEVPEDAVGLRLARAASAAGKHVVWLGTGNPQSCRRWQSRADKLEESGIALSKVDGLSVCPYCAGRCSGPEDADHLDR